MEVNNDSFRDFLREYRNNLPEVGRYAEVPVIRDSLQDGRDVYRVGYVNEYRSLNHPQGENSYNFKGTCGLVSCEDILRQFGVEKTPDGRKLNEDYLVEYAAVNGLCHLSDNPAEAGGTNPYTQVELLKRHGIPAHIEIINDVETLATNIEDGRGVLLGVNAGVLWNEAGAFGNGEANHAIVLTGLARDVKTGAIAGFYINDSGRQMAVGDRVNYEGDSGRFVPIDRFEKAFIRAGGFSVVTDMTRYIQTD